MRRRKPDIPLEEKVPGKPSAKSFGGRLSSCVKEALPGALKTMWWVIRITATVSVVIYILRLTGALPWISRSLEPVMSFIGLPGEASLAYVSGYFVNVYSAIAASASLNLSARSVTILAVLVLCSHNMIVETAVQKKTGSSALWIVLERTFGGLLLAFVLNRILPYEAQGTIGQVEAEQITLASSIGPWALSLLKLCLKTADTQRVRDNEGPDGCHPLAAQAFRAAFRHVFPLDCGQHIGPCVRSRRNVPGEGKRQDFRSGHPAAQYTYLHFPQQYRRPGPVCFCRRDMVGDPAFKMGFVPSAGMDAETGVSYSRQIY